MHAWLLKKAKKKKKSGVFSTGFRQQPVLKGPFSLGLVAPGGKPGAKGLSHPVQMSIILVVDRINV